MDTERRNPEPDDDDEGAEGGFLDNPHEWFTEGAGTDTANASQPPREGPAAPASMPG
jgi:hypothetical protein